VQPRQIVLDLAPEPIIEFVRSEDEESEALEVIGRGWNKSSSSDTKEQLSLLRAKVYTFLSIFFLGLIHTRHFDTQYCDKKIFLRHGSL